MPGGPDVATLRVYLKTGNGGGWWSAEGRPRSLRAGGSLRSTPATQPPWRGFGIGSKRLSPLRGFTPVRREKTGGLRPRLYTAAPSGLKRLHGFVGAFVCP